MGAPLNGVMDICALLLESTNPQAETMIKTIRQFTNGEP